MLLTTSHEPVVGVGNMYTFVWFPPGSCSAACLPLVKIINNRERCRGRTIRIVIPSVTLCTSNAYTEKRMDTYTRSWERVNLNVTVRYYRRELFTHCVVRAPQNGFRQNHIRLRFDSEVELGIFTPPGENVKITPYHRPIIKYSLREFFFL
jgi:hypothetical protein